MSCGNSNGSWPLGYGNFSQLVILPLRRWIFLKKIIVPSWTPVRVSSSGFLATVEIPLSPASGVPPRGWNCHPPPRWQLVCLFFGLSPLEDVRLGVKLHHYILFNERFTEQILFCQIPSMVHFFPLIFSNPMDTS